MAVAGNDLYVATEDIVNFTYGNLFKYDGTNFTQINLPAGHRLQNDLSMAVVGNDLFVATEDIVSFTYGNLFKYDGTNFTQINLPSGHRLQNQLNMAVVGNNLYVATEDIVNFTYGNLIKINYVSDITTSTSGITISANNSSATYKWLDCDNNYSIIPGEISQSFTPSSNGNYAVELTENGCVDTTACVSISTVGIVENSFGDELEVYPNPTNGGLSINLGSSYENAQVIITDISGKLIESKNIIQTEVINLSIQEPAGIYLVSVQSDERKVIIRLIKE
jgi:hypothetical protein